MTPLILLAAVAAEPGLAEDYARAAEGAFSSEAQHRADPRYDWVEARVVRIWPERTDGVWLYQEQAIVSAPGLSPMAARAKPYFQFVARVTQIGSGVLRRDNFRVKDGAAWLGLTAADPRLARLSQADLAPPSCHNRVEKVSSGVFTGRTESCANSYKGAAWMQSLSVTMADVHVNWDRGFDLEGNRVWGPAAGGYVFRRKGG
jgi:hypothetical protein